MPISECMKKFTYKQYILILMYLDNKWNEHTKLDYYLAQLTAEIRRGYVKDPSSVDPKNYLIKFDKSSKEDKPKYGKLYRADGSEIVVTKELITQVKIKERQALVKSLNKS